MRFAGFHLDPANRRLTRAGVPVDVNGRYFDALALLVREAGQLVTKDRFMTEVWRGVPVTDEALTQCIRSLRRLLGDDAAAPRFIQTVPKHGYRFVAAVEPDVANAAPLPASDAWSGLLRGASAGTVGAGVAGLIGGLLYGFAAAGAPGEAGASILLVVLCATVLVALVGGGGVAFGIALARAWGRAPEWRILGGALGGLIVGAAVRLIGGDAFTLLIGRSPGAFTGAEEGLLLGASAGLAAWLTRANTSPMRTAARAALIGAIGGLLITLLGGRLMAGSLALLASFPASHLRLDALGAIFAEHGFGPRTRLATAMVEGALFAAGIVSAMRRAELRGDGVLVRRAPAG